MTDWDHTMDGVARIAAERVRQIKDEGWTPEHDAAHGNGALTEAALCYASAALMLGHFPHTSPTVSEVETEFTALDWPWDEEWWKPGNDPVRCLEKAGALLAAEIDRLLRRREIEDR